LTHSVPPDPLQSALARRREAGTPGAARVARERHVNALRVRDIVCTSGPTDTPFDERHAQVSIAAVVAGTFAYRGEHGRVLLTPGALLLGNADADFRCSHEHGEGDRCLAFHFDAALFERLAADLRVHHSSFRLHCLPPSTSTARLVSEAEATFDDSEALEEMAVKLAAAALGANHEVRPAVVTMRDEQRAADMARLLERRSIVATASRRWPHRPA